MQRIPAGSARYRLTLVALLGSLIFGGASRFDVIGPFIASAIAIIVLALMYSRGRASPLTRLEKLCWGVLAGIFLVQMIPWPPALWAALPGRDFPREIFSQLGEHPWLPLTLTPGRTFLSFLALFPAFAVYVGAKGMTQRDGDRLLLWLVGFGAVSALLGLFQLAGGPSNPLRFYAITNRDAAVGFFSNSNHFGVWLAALVPAVVYLGMNRMAADQRGRRAIAAVTAGVAFLFAIAAIASFSRAAFGAVLLTGIFAGAAFLRLSEMPARRKALIAGVASIVLLGILALALSSEAFERLSEVNDVDPTGRRGRLQYVPVFLRIIADTLPLGTGIGSFDSVNRAYETHLDLGRTYLNNAHNDLAQIVIEAGVAALAALAAWLVLIVRQCGNALSVTGRRDVRDLRRLRAGALILPIFILLAHSLVDYPLRTSAVATTFMLCLALLAGSKRISE